MILFVVQQFKIRLMWCNGKVGAWSGQRAMSEKRRWFFQKGHNALLRNAGAWDRGPWAASAGEGCLAGGVRSWGASAGAGKGGTGSRALLGSEQQVFPDGHQSLPIGTSLAGGVGAVGRIRGSG
ncbi:hypothetical protein [Pedosphaera parvula]|uniref:hypothetical protein n=1 Tax=Pedosphaera parvula TaxID=1032527 RepID=UPI00058E3544|nr:hypothetical protein [Pedosphaera parvula]